MTHRDSAAEFVHRIWPAEPSALAGIRRAVRGWLGPLDLTAEAEDDLVLAVSEAGSNVIDHAYRTPEVAAGIELFFWTEPAVLSIQIVDHGRWQPPGPHSAGNGMGINLMQRLVDFVMIRYDARGTRVLLRHSLPGIERPQPARDPGAVQRHPDHSAIIDDGDIEDMRPGCSAPTPTPRPPSSPAGGGSAPTPSSCLTGGHDAHR